MVQKITFLDELWPVPETPRNLFYMSEGGVKFTIFDFRPFYYLSTQYAPDDNPFVFLGGESRNIVYGNDTFNRMYGYGGDDILHGGDSFDIVFGGSGNDRLWGYDGNDKLHGGTGIDLIYGMGGDDLMTGGHGNDILTGDAGTNMITSGEGKDLIFVQKGDETHLVTDFTSDDNLAVIIGDDTELSIDEILFQLDIRWEIGQFQDTASGTNDENIDDIIIYQRVGTETQADDLVVVVLEDYNEPLTAEDFTVF